MLWLVGCALVLATTVAQAASIANKLSRPSNALHDSYYVVVHTHYGVALATFFLVFAAVYFVFNRLGFAYSAALASMHFWGTAVGASLVFYPATLLAVTGEPARMADYAVVFERLNLASSIGYAVTLTATAMFFVLVADALWRRSRRQVA